MNTRSFLYGLCDRALEIDSSIKFVGVVNIDGKLIAGKSKQLINKQNEVLDKNFLKYCLNSSFNKLSNNADNLDSSINNKDILFHSKLLEQSDFHLICVRADTFIAFAPLTEELNNYLCIYFKVFDSINEILSKLDTVFEYNE